MQITGGVHSYKVLSPSCYPLVNNKSVVRLMGAIRLAGLVIHHAGKLVRGKRF